jgi:hypothetical protein
MCCAGTLRAHAAVICMSITIGARKNTGAPDAISTGLVFRIAVHLPFGAKII